MAEVAAIAAAEAPAVQPAARRSGLLPPLPYPGIRPYEKAEWPIFCGRQRIVDELLENLGDARFLPVLGTSGCGKSSVIKAGLIATLEREHGRLGASWRTVEMRPANAPMWGLAEALWAATRPGGPAQAGVPPPEQVAAVRTLLGQGPGGIERILKTHGFPEDHNLLLHVDQFEELFRFGALGGEAEAEAFVDQLVDVFDGQPRSIYLVATMRTDFLGDCARLQRLADAFNQTAYLLRRMTNAELREAIERPARLFRGRVEPKLVDRLIRDAGREQDQLPLLEHALMWMWVQGSRQDRAPVLTLDHYLGPEVGGVEGALSQHADRIYEGLGDATLEGETTPRDLRPVAKHLFQALSDVDRDGRVIRRPLPFGELCVAVGAEPSAVRHVIDEFRKPGRSFLMPPYGKQIEDRTPIDVSHEALIRQWSKMKGASGDTDWVAEEQKDGDTWQSLAQAARKFRKNPRRLLPSDESAEYQAWQQARVPNAAWARRYTPGGDDLFNDARMLLDKSERSRRRHVAGKWLAGLAIGVAVFGGLLLTGGMLAQQQYNAEITARNRDITARNAEITAQRDKLAQTVAEKNAAIAARITAEEATIIARARAFNDALAARSQKASSDWRTTDALVLAADALTSPNEEPSAEAAAFAGLLRHREVARYADPDATDSTPHGPIAVLSGDRKVQIIDPSTLGVNSELTLPNGGIYNVAMHPDGAQLAVAYHEPAQVELWDTGKRALIATYPTNGRAHNLWFSPNGHWLAIADDSDVRVIDTTNATIAQHWTHDNVPESVVFSPDSHFFATATREGGVVSVRLEPPSTPVDQSRFIEGSNVGAVAFDPSGHWLAVPASQGKITLIDMETGAKPQALGTLPDPVTAVFRPLGAWLAVGHANGTVSALDINTRAIVTVAKMDAAVSWLAFSPDGTLLAVATDDGTAHLVEFPSGKERAVLRGKEALIYVAFVANGQRLFTYGGDVRLWSVDAAIAPDCYDTRADQSSGVAILHPSSCLPPDSDVQRGRQGPGKSGSRSSAETRAAAPAILAVDGEALGPAVLDLSTARPIIRAAGLPSIPVQLPPADSFGPVVVSGALDWARQRLVLADGDGRLLALAIESNGAVPQGPLPSLTPAPGGGVGVSLAMGADGSIIAVYDDGRAEFVDAEKRQSSRSFHRGRGLAVDPYRRQVLQLAGDGHLWVADLDEEVPHRLRVLPLLDASDRPVAGAFSHDGRFVAVVHESGTLAVWDIERAGIVAKVGDPSQRLAVPGFAADDDAIMAASTDGRVFVWPFLGREALIHKIDTALPQGVTEREKRAIRGLVAEQ
jgi:WD40 repeat protein